jgi:predicted transcriptional regulator of viral defense system
MRTTDALGELQQLGRAVVERREVIARLGVSPARASQILRALEHSGLVSRLGKGLWLLDRGADPFSIPPYLTAPFPAYVSMWSALARHGMIDQIPRQIFVASLDRPRTIETPIGTYSVHHLAPEVFGGYTGTAATGYVATPEKALFDTIYLRAARRRRTYLPELELPDSFEGEELSDWTGRIPSARIRTLVARELESLLGSPLRRSSPT